MKASIDYHFPRKAFGDERALQVIREAGFEALDFTFYWLPEDEDPLNQPNYAQYARKLRAVADDCGLFVTQAHAPFVFNSTDTPEKQAHDLRNLHRSLEFAAILGANSIVVHNVTTENPADFRSYNLDFYNGFADECRAHGIKIAVENLWSMKDNKVVGGRLSTPEELSAFLDQLDPACFCACIDVGHSAIVGQNPGDFIRKLGTPKLQALHIQDTDLMRDSHMLPFLGKHNWEDITKALAEADYQGDFSLEVFNFTRNIPKEELPLALKLASRIAHHLIDQVEEYRKQK